MLKRNLFSFGPFRLDATQGLLTRGDKPVTLPPKVFAVLCLLAEQRGGVVSKTTLMETLWPESYVGESSLTQNIFLLRKALGRTEDGLDYIETLSKRGYRLAVPVEVLQGPDIGAQTAVEPENTIASIESAQSSTAQLISLEAGTLNGVPDRRSSNRDRRRLAFWYRKRGLVSAGITVLVLVVGGYLVGRRLLMWDKKPMILRSRRLTNDGFYKEHLIPLLTDNTHIYFSEDIGTTSYLAEVSREGGETTRRKSPTASSMALSYSKTRNEILFGALWESMPDHPLLAQSLPDGVVHAVGGLSGHSASWSPDGKWIAYAKGLSLFVADSNGNNIHELAHMAEAPNWPRWSSDGRRIRFSVPARNEVSAIWEIEATGQSLRPLFSDEPWGRQACCGDWTADGRYYIFVVDEGRRSTLWSVPDQHRRWRSSAPVELADGPADFWRAPLAAPDGRHIFALGEQARGRLMKYDPQSQRFEPFLDGLSTDTITFSRDGQWIAYTAYPDGTLWRSRVDGSERLRLTDSPKPARFPQWSPDGSELIYIAADETGQWKVHRVSANGGQSEELVRDETSQGAATWSSDGTRIAFGEIVKFGVNKQEEKIRVLDLRSKKVTDIPNSNGLWTARWSPDGRYLCAVTTDNQKLMLYDFENSQWRQLADVGTNDVVWSRDSQQILFDSPNEAVIYHVSLKDYRLTKDINLGGMRRTGFYGWSLNIAPDNNPVLLEEAGINEVYSLQAYFP
jgi:Tol biopolymer transport system component/DNA-binding winged helix-turn-helix (wHTH) protein